MQDIGKKAKISKANDSKTILQGLDSNRLVRGNSTFESVQRLELGALPEQDVAREPPRQRLGHLIAGVRAGGHGKHVVKFFQGALFGLGHEEEDQDQCGDVQAGVETKRSDRVERDQEPREGDGENSGPEQAGCHRPTHPDLPMRQREDFGRVRKRDWSLTGRVKGREQEDEECNQAEVSPVVLVNDKTKTGGKQGPSHLRESEEQERSATPGVDGPNGGPGKRKVDETESPGGKKRLQVSSIGELEHC